MAPRPIYALLPALVLLLSSAMAVDICSQVTSCRRNGGTVCQRGSESCPPCIYELQDTFTCWEKDNVTNTCPFTGVKYDCSSAWSTTNATPTPTDSGNSQIIMYAAIGGGALLLVIIVVLLIVRRRRRGRNMPNFGAHSPQAFNTKRGAKAATANTPYANAPATGKGGAYGYHRKHSDPVLLESSMVNVNPSSDYSTQNTTTDSLDAMLVENTPPTAVLGDPPLPRTRSKRGISRNFPRINSGGSSRRGSAAYSDKPTRKDTIPPRSTKHSNNPNVFDEYLKMKQEMQFDSDAMSDYQSDMMSSIDRFSLQSSSTVGAAESDYLGDLMRSRTESECFSEMSYNDEKYSFSEDSDPMLSASSIKKVDKEVEI